MPLKQHDVKGCTCTTRDRTGRETRQGKKGEGDKQPARRSSPCDEGVTRHYDGELLLLLPLVWRKELEGGKKEICGEREGEKGGLCKFTHPTIHPSIHPSIHHPTTIQPSICRA